MNSQGEYYLKTRVNIFREEGGGGGRMQDAYLGKYKERKADWVNIRGSSLIKVNSLG